MSYIPPLEKSDGPRGAQHRRELSLARAMRAGEVICSRGACRSLASVLVTHGGVEQRLCRVHALDYELDRTIARQKEARAAMRASIR